MTMAISEAPISLAGAEAAQPTSKDVTAEKDYWNNFYARFNISHPSQFCVMTAIEADRSCPIVEFGCGNARDSIYFATHGYKVYACDLSKDAIEKNAEKNSSIEGLDFEVVDASAEDQVRAVVEKARTTSGAANVTVYTRFFLHSIDQTQEDKFLAALAEVLSGGDKLYFEYRCSMDEKLDKVHGKEHYRRYVDTPVMLEGLAKLGFAVEYEMTGRGMAKYKVEDPFVSRVILRKL
mmetsp:Transcript_24261/g.39431  ORF Transcript_24261/g.39431 Transcript_24261/m.39431 type:complete len:236 (+) Transcript_24261:64-771(+)|eukprot:CAMPEP_0196135456 /NCGR_PEP_ID=MMETSP0910-20130528/4093_1 /TAXON_ID=49265 /ORGANISM="Thalassiosira rotula, Strain GSO102" /LENGTH=235 /DNA_ID=CAMNT_0041395601 /DNA_START=91 /DNA_END=798 /DNA_ORIENTATION=+